MYLREIANEVKAILIPICHHIEEEGISVIVESLVVQKHLGHQAQVLCIGLKKYC